MVDNADEKLEQVWYSLWQEDSPYYVPTVMRDGLRTGKGNMAPLTELTFSDTGMIPLFDKAPWGAVSINLKDNCITGIFSISSDGLEYDASSRDLTAHINFNDLIYSGTYTVVSNGLTGTVADTLNATLSAIPSQEPARGEDKIVFTPEDVAKNERNAPPTPTTSPGIQQAQAYRTKLLQTDNGKKMVATYYDHNLTYSELFQLDSVKNEWLTHETPPSSGKTTRFYANHTTASAQNPSHNLNGHPDERGYSDYNAHSYYQSTVILSTCLSGSRHYNKRGDNEKAQRYLEAGKAVNGFKTTTLPHSKQPQSIDSVMHIVQTEPTPADDELVSHTDDELMAGANDETHPQWLQDIHAQAAKVGDAAREELEQRENAIIDTGSAVNGTCTSSFSVSSLTLHGTLSADGTVTFSRFEGTLPKVEIAISEFSGGLCFEVQQALDEAQFFQDMFNTRLHAALTGGLLLNTLSRLTNIALAG